MTQPTKHITSEEVKKFLEIHYLSPIGSFLHIQEGKHSDAFSYTHDGKDFVIRFNVTDKGFLKDVYAYENFSQQILIPKIFETGMYTNSLFYCISEKVTGEIVKDQYTKGDFSSLYVQFETIEAIKEISIPEDNTFGKWNEKGVAHMDFDTYVTEICTGGISDWNVFEDIRYFDKNFVEYLLVQIQKYSEFSQQERALVHGDFGGSNLLIAEGKISGIIDWAHSFYGDHFWDVGRVVLFCPNKKETTEAALNFYKDTYSHYKERIAWGVYCVMLKNYGVALQSGQEASCLSSAGRIKEIEDILKL